MRVLVGVAVIVGVGVFVNVGVVVNVGVRVLVLVGVGVAEGGFIILFLAISASLYVLNMYAESTFAVVFKWIVYSVLSNFTVYVIVWIILSIL